MGGRYVANIEGVKESVARGEGETSRLRIELSWEWCGVVVMVVGQSQGGVVEAEGWPEWRQSRVGTRLKEEGEWRASLTHR